MQSVHEGYQELKRSTGSWLAALLTPLRQVARSKVGRTLILSVFASTLLIEMVILVPSVIKFRKDQVAQLLAAESDRIAALFRALPADQAIMYAADRPALTAIEARDASGKLLARWGTAHLSAPAAPRLMEFADTQVEVVHAGQRLSLRLRCDTRQIGVQVRRYILHIIGLVLLIVLFVVAVTADVLRRKVLLPLEYQARHDPLTGLPNRAYFDQQLRHSIETAARSGVSAALMYIDLDRFKDFNDNFGHSQGDALLIEVSRRLQMLEGMPARLGGDEFGLILPLSNVEHASQAAAQTLEALSRPYRYNQFHFLLSASIGVALLPQHGADPESAQRNADIAMYVAKRAGRSRVSLFDTAMSQAVSRRKELEDWLRIALERDEFSLHYQPKISVRSGEIAGAEALLRWTRPGYGPISPAEFIPVAEESGLIVPLGLWVLNQALKQMQHWHAAGFKLPKVSVNVSANQFQDENFLGSLLALLDGGALPAQRLDLEITEGTLMADPDSAVQVLDALRQRGVTVSLDDFGTGYSSLSYLKRLPVETLKIDRSFIADLHTDSDSTTIVKAIIGMGHSLGMNLVAEGVETAAQWSLLKGWNCDEYQGYWASAALAPEAFVQFCKDCPAPVEDLVNA